MKPFTIIAIAFLSALPAGAVIIEDSETRLEFELFWHPPSGFSGGVGLNLGPEFVPPGSYSGFTGTGGSGLWLDNANRNQYFYRMNVQRVIDGVVQPAQGFSIVFRTTGEDPFIPAANLAFGPNVFFGVPAFEVPGQPYAARVILGLAHPVPEAGATLPLLALGWAALAGLARRRASVPASPRQ